MRQAGKLAVLPCVIRFCGDTRHHWQHSLRVFLQPGGLAACSRWLREPWRPIPPDHEAAPFTPPHPGRDASQRLFRHAVSTIQKRGLAAIPPGWNMEGDGKFSVSGGVALRAQPPATGGEPSGFKFTKPHDARYTSKALEGRRTTWLCCDCAITLEFLPANGCSDP